VLANVLAVVSNAQVAEQLRQLGCQVLFYSEAQQGMGASLAYAVTHVVTHFPDAQSVLIGLADMPYVQPDTVSAIVTQLEQGATIVQPIFEEQPGHPVGFARCHFPALMALQGDTGARHLLREFPVLRLPVADRGIILDIDYLSDLPLTP
jgi:molybdenum cofactor cytidylyltransferase